MTLGPPPPLDRRNAALFLDLDGTLAEIEARPEQVVPQPRRTHVLTTLVAAMDGRVAVLTGRTLAEADRILDGAVPAVGAVHGLVRRLPDGTIIEQPPAATLPDARRQLEALAAERGLLIEDKGSSIALHYRRAPEAAEAARAAVRRVSDATGLLVQEGAMVSELRTPGPDKGDALKAFLAAPPFAGRIPVMVGDDLTDEHAFAAAEEAGGHGILVGPPRETRARFRLDGVADVLAWLDDGDEA